MKVADKLVLFQLVLLVCGGFVIYKYPLSSEALFNVFGFLLVLNIGLFAKDVSIRLDLILLPIVFIIWVISKFLH